MYVQNMSRGTFCTGGPLAIVPTGRKTSRLRSLCLERVLFGTETRWGLYIRQKLKRGLFVAGLWIGVDQNRLHSEKQ